MGDRRTDLGRGRAANHKNQKYALTRNANFEFASSQRHDANQRRTADSGVEFDAWYVRPDRVESGARGKRKLTEHLPSLRVMRR